MPYSLTTVINESNESNEEWKSFSVAVRTYLAFTITHHVRGTTGNGTLNFSGDSTPVAEATCQKQAQLVL